MPLAHAEALSRPEDILSDLPVAIATDLQTFVTGLNEVCDAALLVREMPVDIARSLNDRAVDRLPEGRFVLKFQEVVAALKALFETQGIDEDPALEWLTQDAAQLARALSLQFDTGLVRLRLEVIDDDACAKLHIDNVTARLICAYRGPGTQIGFPESAAETLYTAPTGQPLLLKGTRWPGTRPNLRHKSPPMQGSGETRLVLVLEGVAPADIYPEYDTLFGAAKTEWDAR